MLYEKESQENIPDDTKGKKDRMLEFIMPKTLMRNVRMQKPFRDHRMRVGDARASCARILSSS
jgi:hypothetical protein